MIHLCASTVSTIQKLLDLQMNTVLISRVVAKFTHNNNKVTRLIFDT